MGYHGAMGSPLEEATKKQQVEAGQRPYPEMVYVFFVPPKRDRNRNPSWEIYIRQYQTQVACGQPLLLRKKPPSMAHASRVITNSQLLFSTGRLSLLIL